MFGLFAVADSDIDEVGEFKFVFCAANFFCFFSPVGGLAVNFIEFTLDIIIVNSGTEWHTVEVARVGSIGVIDVGVCIYSNYAETSIGERFFHSADSTAGCAMVTGNHNSEIIIQYRISNRVANLEIDRI